LRLHNLALHWTVSVCAVIDRCVLFAHRGAWREHRR